MKESAETISDGKGLLRGPREIVVVQLKTGERPSNSSNFHLQADGLVLARPVNLAASNQIVISCAERSVKRDSQLRQLRSLPLLLSDLRSYYAIDPTHIRCSQMSGGAGEREPDEAIDRIISSLHASDEFNEVGTFRSFGDPRLAIGYVAGGSCEIELTIIRETCRIHIQRFLDRASSLEVAFEIRSGLSGELLVRTHAPLENRSGGSSVAKARLPESFTLKGCTVRSYIRTGATHQGGSDRWLLAEHEFGDRLNVSSGTQYPSAGVTSQTYALLSPNGVLQFRSRLYTEGALGADHGWKLSWSFARGALRSAVISSQVLESSEQAIHSAMTSGARVSFSFDVSRLSGGIFVFDLEVVRGDLGSSRALGTSGPPTTISLDGILEAHSSNEKIAPKRGGSSSIIAILHPVLNKESTERIERLRGVEPSITEAGGRVSVSVMMKDAATQDRELLRLLSARNLRWSTDLLGTVLNEFNPVFVCDPMNMWRCADTIERLRGWSFLILDCTQGLDLSDASPDKQVVEEIVVKKAHVLPEITDVLLADFRKSQQFRSLDQKTGVITATPTIRIVGKPEPNCWFLRPEILPPHIVVGVVTMKGESASEVAAEHCGLAKSDRRVTVEVIVPTPNSSILGSINHFLRKYRDSDVLLVQAPIRFTDPRAVGRLAQRAYASHDIFAVGALIRDEGGRRVKSAGTVLPSGQFRAFDDLRYRTYPSVPYLTTTLMYLRRDYLNLVGVFDEQFTPSSRYGEIDLHYRAYLMGFRTVVVPECFATFIGSPDTILPEQIDAIAKDRVLFLDKHHRNPTMLRSTL